ncbi:unnamed protein product [Calicophoron daubneyi]|uniref:Uncharacterized protein n=1 Tax=Calicophoron daubneyi TaxID=300641 RepID=A0AAV2TTM6_CALDB
MQMHSNASLLRKHRNLDCGSGCLICTPRSVEAEHLHHSLLDTADSILWRLITTGITTPFMQRVYEPLIVQGLIIISANAFNPAADPPYSYISMAGDFGLSESGWRTNCALINTGFLFALLVARKKQPADVPLRLRDTLNLIFTLNMHFTGYSVPAALFLTATTGWPAAALQCPQLGTLTSTRYLYQHQ